MEQYDYLEPYGAPSSHLIYHRATNTVRLLSPPSLLTTMTNPPNLIEPILAVVNLEGVESVVTPFFAASFNDYLGQYSEDSPLPELTERSLVSQLLDLEVYLKHKGVVHGNVNGETVRVSDGSEGPRLVLTRWENAFYDVDEDDGATIEALRLQIGERWFFGGCYPDVEGSSIYRNDRPWVEAFGRDEDGRGKDGDRLSSWGDAKKDCPLPPVPTLDEAGDCDENDDDANDALTELPSQHSQLSSQHSSGVHTREVHPHPSPLPHAHPDALVVEYENAKKRNENILRESIERMGRLGKSIDGPLREKLRKSIDGPLTSTAPNITGGTIYPIPKTVLPTTVCLPHLGADFRLHLLKHSFVVRSSSIWVHVTVEGAAAVGKPKRLGPATFFSRKGYKGVFKDATFGLSTRRLRGVYEVEKEGSTPFASHLRKSEAHTKSGRWTGAVADQSFNTVPYNKAGRGVEYKPVFSCHEAVQKLVAEAAKVVKLMGGSKK
ncbi:hypothetical protein TrRE_jg1633, partial [Triparma retinervis]